MSTQQWKVNVETGWIAALWKNSLHGSRYSRIDQEKFVEDSLWKNLSDMVCLGKFLSKFLLQIN